MFGQSNERIAKHKLRLLNLAEELSNISKFCKIMGFSRENKELTFLVAIIQ